MIQIEAMMIDRKKLMGGVARALCRADLDDYGEADIAIYMPLAQAVLAVIEPILEVADSVQNMTNHLQCYTESCDLEQEDNYCISLLIERAAKNFARHEAALEVDLPAACRPQLATDIDARLHALSQTVPAALTHERQVDAMVRQVCQAVRTVVDTVVDEPRRFGLSAALRAGCRREARRRGAQG